MIETQQTQTVPVSLDERSYDIVIGANVIDDPAVFGRGEATGKAIVVTNAVVGPLLGERVTQTLRHVFSEVHTVTLVDGEGSKRWETLNQIFDSLVRLSCDRATTLVALGGGVVGDITGFAAACYMRGIDFMQVPTTLLAQVDSSVGGKTGINHPAGKNLIGAFHQPRHVVVDVSVLNTLPRRELLSGLAEVIKYGATTDAAFLDWIEDHLQGLLSQDSDSLVYAVTRSCRIKAEIVAADEHESGRRAILNFGHTFGHAIELGLGYGTWLHGEAVACGMVLAAKLSTRMGLIDRDRADRLEALISRAGLPTQVPTMAASSLIDLMRADKKALHGELRFVLLEGQSGALLSAAPEELVKKVIAEQATR